MKQSFLLFVCWRIQKHRWVICYKTHNGFKEIYGSYDVLLQKISWWNIKILSIQQFFWRQNFKQHEVLVRCWLQTCKIIPDLKMWSRDKFLVTRWKTFPVFFNLISIHCIITLTVNHLGNLGIVIGDTCSLSLPV